MLIVNKFGQKKKYVIYNIWQKDINVFVPINFTKNECYLIFIQVRMLDKVSRWNNKNKRLWTSTLCDNQFSGYVDNFTCTLSVEIIQSNLILSIIASKL